MHIRYAIDCTSQRSGVERSRGKRYLKQTCTYSKYKEREREGERERASQTDRESDRQGETERQTDLEKETDR